MKWLNDNQKAYFFAIRDFMDRKIQEIPTASEAEFNAAAEKINTDVVAIRIWKGATEEEQPTYQRGDIRIDPEDGIPYWAVTTHTSYVGQECQPSKTETIWTHCHGTSVATAREFKAEGHNPYQPGHFCREDGKVFKCNTANTVHAPSVLPQAWDEVAVN